MAQIYGYLLGWNGYADDADIGDRRAQFENAIIKSRYLSVDKNGPAHVLPRWGVLRFDSPQSLSRDDDPGFIDGHYRYKVWYRVNEATGTVIIASELFKITDAVISYFNFDNKPNLDRKVINVQQLCLDILSKRIDRYLLTYYLADVPGYGASLRSIALYGDDIGEADFIADERKNFRPRQIGVRPSDNRYELGRFGNAGTVQFFSERIPILENFLSFAREADLYIS